MDPILDSVENKSGTKYYKVGLPDGTMVYHADYDNGSNTKKGFYKSYEKSKMNFEDDTSRLNTAQQKLDDANADLGSIFGFLKLKNFSSILAKMRFKSIFLQEPAVSSFKNQWYLPTRNQCLDLQGNVPQMPVSIL